MGYFSVNLGIFLERIPPRDFGVMELNEGFSFL